MIFFALLKFQLTNHTLVIGIPNKVIRYVKTNISIMPVIYS
jgi:hypothetical protein